MNESISVREVRAETRQQSLAAVLEVQFPGAVLADVLNRLRAEPDPEVLRRWFRLAATAATLDAFQAGMN